jgi:imidazolonepropionase-like amidohydrolase
MRATALAAFAVVTSFCGGAAAQVTVLTNATVIDGTGSPPQSTVAIVIADGRIIDLVQPPPGTLTRLLTAPGTTVVDLAGKFVVPGIINGHGHVGPPPRDPQLRQYARYGVTTTTSMYFDQDDVQQFKERRDRRQGRRLHQSVD